MLNRCLFLVQFRAGLAAPLVATSSTVFDGSPVADRHVQVSACVRTDCSVLLSEQSHGSFESMPATFFGDIIHDCVLLETHSDVTSVDKDIKAAPQVHRFIREDDSSTSTVLNRCLFLVQFCAGLAAPLVATSSTVFDGSPVADRHVQVSACVRTDCSVLLSEQSHGSFESMPATFFGDIILDCVLLKTHSDVTSVDKDIKAAPQVHRFIREDDSSTSTVLNRCLFLVQFCAGLAAPLVATSSTVFDGSPVADRHVQVSACVRTDCSVLLSEQSHGSFESMPATFFGDIIHDCVLLKTHSDVTSVDKDIKAAPQVHRFIREGDSSTSTVLNRCLFLVQFCAGLAAPLVATSSTVFDGSPVADRHVQVSACVRTDCSVLLSEQSHGSFESMPATFFGDIIHDCVLLKTHSDVTSVDKDIKAAPQVHRFIREGDSSTSTVLNRCLFLVQFCAGLAAPLVATSSTVFDGSPVADRHVQVSACVRTDCSVLLSEQSHGSFESMPATFFGDIIHDCVLLKTHSDVTSVDKDIKAAPQVHRFIREGDSSTSTVLNRCLFLVQFCAGLAAPLVATSSTVFDGSPVADRHVQVSACVRTDCSVLLSEQSHGSFESMPATFFGDIIHDCVLLKTHSDVTSVDKDIKAAPQVHRFIREGDSSTSTMLNRCLFFVQVQEKIGQGLPELMRRSHLASRLQVTPVEILQRREPRSRSVDPPGL
ncbi:uncharacterized protein LOC125756475 [Rhipicephalus sanguineus]|uniref:uncharacterized protein LOC125756475 n=1 Tax=Rhipicephalus sanguineus TaxID=34632 RepID=UPI0020C49E52|nr:uncharacterized protein LOC125756475 [Rhipicephalus sanguineus]